MCPNGPSTECSGSVAAVACACRVVGMMKDEKQKKKQMSPKVKNIVRASVSNGYASSSEVSYKCINEVKIKFLFFLISFFILRDNIVETESHSFVWSH